MKELLLSRTWSDEDNSVYIYSINRSWSGAKNTYVCRPHYFHQSRFHLNKERVSSNVRVV